MHTVRTDKKENEHFLIHKEVQMESVAKSYMRKGFLIYEEMRKYLTILRRPSIIYDFTTDPSDFPYILYEENLIFFFYQCDCRDLGNRSDA
jgi:hypothetical protein